MGMSERIREIIDDIELKSHTEDEWLELEKKVARYLAVMSEKEKQQFVESCAAESLTMMCSGIRYMRAMRSYGVEYDEDGMVTDWGQLEEEERLEYNPKTGDYTRKARTEEGM